MSAYRLPCVREGWTLVHGFDTNYKRRNKVRIGDDYINGNNELLKEVVDKEQLYIPAEFEG